MFQLLPSLPIIIRLCKESQRASEILYIRDISFRPQEVNLLIQNLAALFDEKQITSQTIRQIMWAPGFQLLVYLRYSYTLRSHSNIAIYNVTLSVYLFY